MLEGNWVPFLVKCKVKSEQMFLTEYDNPLPAIIFLNSGKFKSEGYQHFFTLVIVKHFRRQKSCD